jgi:fructose-1-phosphate kinase PfkB-like protein
MELDGVATVTLNAALDHSLDCPGFRAGAVNRVASHWMDPGGKGINVAAFLADWVRPVTATGFLGRDNALPFEALFRDKGIEDRCHRVAGQTRVNLKVLDQPVGQVTDINLPGVRIREEDWEALKRDLVSTVGAGDAMLAGVLASLVRGEDLEGCARRGTAFAVGTLTRRGPVLPPRAEVEALMARVKVEDAG